jgi:hypothetical protein
MPKLPQPNPVQEQHLTQMLQELDPSVDPLEAHRMAHEAIVFSRTLAVRYHVDTSPWVHNLLVNVHLRDRGLCYQWADDLYRHLTALHLHTLALYPIGANIGNYLAEHNALAVLPTRHAATLEYGTLLDPWRRSGDLLFMPVGEDTKYRWRVRPERVPATTHH